MFLQSVDSCSFIVLCIITLDAISFNQLFNWSSQTIKRLLLNIKPKDIGTIVLSSPGEDPKMLINFKDLLEKIFVLDPDKRITVSQALSHPFITGK